VQCLLQYVNIVYNSVNMNDGDLPVIMFYFNKATKFTLLDKKTIDKIKTLTN